jgi:hypothetical protein
MKQLLLLLPFLLVPPALAGDLGPADLPAEQMAAAFPPIGTKWDAWCGSYKKRVDCSVELGETSLIVDGTFEVPYSSILRSEKWDAMMAIVRLAKPDPAWLAWNDFRRNANQVAALSNTVLIEYKTQDGSPQAALITFRENRVLDWYGFANAMRLISYGARPASPSLTSSKATTKDSERTKSRSR